MPGQPARLKTRPAASATVTQPREKKLSPPTRHWKIHSSGRSNQTVEQDAKKRSELSPTISSTGSASTAGKKRKCTRAKKLSAKGQQPPDTAVPRPKATTGDGTSHSKPSGCTILGATKESQVVGSQPAANNSSTSDTTSSPAHRMGRPFHRNADTQTWIQADYRSV